MGKVKRAMSQGGLVIHTKNTFTWVSKRLLRRHDIPGMHPKEKEWTLLSEGLAAEKCEAELASYLMLVEG